jgi:hypothetical protein
MPIHQGYTTRNGKTYGYYQWGNQKKYLYIPGNERSRKMARQKAVRQAQAVYSAGYR